MCWAERLLRFNGGALKHNGWRKQATPTLATRLGFWFSVSRCCCTNTEDNPLLNVHYRGFCYMLPVKYLMRLTGIWNCSECVLLRIIVSEHYGQICPVSKHTSPKLLASKYYAKGDPCAGIVCKASCEWRYAGVDHSVSFLHKGARDRAPSTRGGRWVSIMRKGPLNEHCVQTNHKGLLFIQFPELPEHCHSGCEGNNRDCS